MDLIVMLDTGQQTDDALATEELLIEDLSNFPKIPRKVVLREFFDQIGSKTGEIRIEDGADGAYLLFDCDCLDALPYCRAQCCALIGTAVTFEELASLNYPVELDNNLRSFVMQRDADGNCICLDRETKRCSIYSNRPQTCRAFHCTKGASQRGWKLANSVSRQSMS